MPVIRITIPDDDEVTNGFFAHQGPRSRSIAVRMLAQLFVSEYGYTDVMNVIGKRLVTPEVTGHGAVAPAEQTQSQVADDVDGDGAEDTVAEDTEGAEDTEDTEGIAPDEQPTPKKPAKNKKKAPQKQKTQETQSQPADEDAEDDSDAESAPTASAPTPTEMDDLFNINRNR